MQTQNAVVESTKLGIERGCLTYWINVEHQSGHQGYGGVALDAAPEVKKIGAERVGTAAGLEAIRKLLDTLEVQSWEDLPGTPCRVKRNNLIHGIGHFVKDQWFSFEDLDWDK